MLSLNRAGRSSPFQAVEEAAAFKSRPPDLANTLRSLIASQNADSNSLMEVDGQSTDLQLQAQSLSRVRIPFIHLKFVQPKDVFDLPPSFLHSTFHFHIFAHLDIPPTYFFPSQTLGYHGEVADEGCR